MESLETASPQEYLRENAPVREEPPIYLVGCFCLGAVTLPSGNCGNWRVRITYPGSRSTPDARRGVKSNGTGPILSFPCGKVKRPPPPPHKNFQILGEAAPKTNFKWGLKGIFVPSSVRHWNHAVQQREAAVIGKPVAGQPKFLHPSGETTAAGLGPTPDFLDYAR